MLTARASHAFVSHVPCVSTATQVIAEQEQQQESQKQPEQELRGRRREVLPLQVLKHYAAGMGWQYEVRGCVGAWVSGWVGGWKGVRAVKRAHIW